jgi:ribosomal protein L22
MSDSENARDEDATGAAPEGEAEVTAAAPDAEPAADGLADAPGDAPEAEPQASGAKAEKVAAKASKRPRVRRKAGAAAEKKADEKAGAATKASPKRTPRSAAGATGASRRARRRVVRARARYVRTSARKARIVCVHLRGKSVAEARAILAFTPREVARDWSKLLESAVANAESNHELLEDDLIVREAYADEGPTIKRFRPRAMGRATPIHKRTSHLTITLTPGP